MAHVADWKKPKYFPREIYGERLLLPVVLLSLRKPVAYCSAQIELRKGGRDLEHRGSSLE